MILNLCRNFSTLSILLFIVISVSAESQNDKESWDQFLGAYDHRIKIRAGGGLGKLNSEVLNEVKPTWAINSYLRSAADPQMPISIPLNSTKNLNTIPTMMDISYGWKNKFEISFSNDVTVGKYNKSDPSTAQFLTPRTDRYFMSAYEGVRLLRFESHNEILRFAYTHPIRNRFKIGPSFGIINYSEKDELSFGSYSTRRDIQPDPNLATWSIGGSATAEYNMKGIAPGIVARFRIFPWWEIKSRIELIRRSGDFSLTGSQILQKQDANLQNSYAGVIPLYFGRAKDSGQVFMIESSFRYCRFTLDAGFIHQVIERSYSSYFGDTFGSTRAADYSTRSAGIGLSEMSRHFKQSTSDFYIMPGVSFHF